MWKYQKVIKGINKKNSVIDSIIPHITIAYLYMNTTSIEIQTLYDRSKMAVYNLQFKSFVTFLRQSNFFTCLTSAAKSKGK